jgi:hypothetical protein
MANVKNLEIDRRVNIAMSVLSSSQKAMIAKIIRSPQAFAAFAAVPRRVQQMRITGQPLYMMKVSRSLRLIYTTIGETISVVDLVERATLNHFAVQKATKTNGKFAGSDSTTNPTP